MGLAVLYMTGWCRSGSTVLAEVPGFFPAGDLRYRWQNGVLGTGGNRRCGCGENQVDCPLRSAVLAAVTPPGQPVAAHAADVIRWQGACRARHTWPVLRRPPRDGWPGTLAATYRAIAAQTGGKVIAGSSKFASDAALPRHLSHTVTGSPNRFERGRTRPAEDVRWRTELSLPQRPTATIVASPQLARYGYTRRV